MSAPAPAKAPAHHAAIVELLEQENRRRIEPHVINMGYKYTMADENVPVPGTERPDASPVYRNGHQSLDEQQRERGRATYHGPNFVRRFADLCAARRDSVAFAYRPVAITLRETVPGFEAPMEVTHFAPTKYLTFGDMWGFVENVGRGLLELGEKPGNTVCLFLETRWEWMASAFAVWSRGMVLGTVYANLGVEQLEKAFKETECTTIITGAGRVRDLLGMMQRGAMQRARLVVVDDAVPGAAPVSPIVATPTAATGAAGENTVYGVAPEVLAQYELVDWQDLARRGAAAGGGAPAIPDNNDTLALIMYTSGTTGEPKGVMHTFGSISAGIRNFEGVVDNYAHPKQANDSYICAMPLAHIFEFSITSVFMARGDLVCFGSPRTLMDAFARPHGDLKEFKPCVLIGVPRIFDMIKKAVELALPAEGTLERAIYEHAYETRNRYLREGFETPFWNEILFNRFRQITGGRMRCMLCGGGPLSAPTQDFLNVVMGSTVQGWGMTETISNGAAQLNGDLDTFCIGALESTVEMRLADTEQYKHTDKPEPRGEICLRGPFLFKGYYKKPELTAEVLDEDGFFHTGDVGAIAPRGRLRLIGRVKALAKNSVGEFIPIEALESLYAGHPLSAPNGVCVLVHPHRNFIAAIVCTDEAKLRAFLRQVGLERRAETTAWSLLLDDPEIVQLASDSFRQLARRAGRGTQEVVKRVCLVPHVWTPESGVLTAAGKIKRHEIEERYKETIEFLFKE